MNKGPGFAYMAITVFAALVFTPSASAVVLTSGGVAVPPNTEVTGKNTGFIEFTGSGITIMCESADLTIKITSNSGTAIKGEVAAGGFSLTGTGTSGDCTSQTGLFSTVFNSKLCLETIKGTDNVNITGCGGNITFTTNVTGLGACTYSTASMNGTLVTNADATFNVFEQPVAREAGGVFCPTTWKLDFDLDLTAMGGGTLAIS